MCEQHFEVVRMTVCAKTAKSQPHSEAIVRKIFFFFCLLNEKDYGPGEKWLGLLKQNQGKRQAS